MDNTWNKLYDAAKQVLNPREISKMIEAGGVAAAIESTSGKIYVGVCVDTARHQQQEWYCKRICRAQCDLPHDYQW